MTKNELQEEICRLLHSGIVNNAETWAAAVVLSALQRAITEGTDAYLSLLVTGFARPHLPISDRANYRPEEILEREA